MSGVLRWLTAGESHGPALVAVLEGLPAGVRITTDEIADALARRRAGYGRGARMSFERDEVELLGGVRHGRTQGGPVAVRIGNTEWPKWDRVMSPDPVPADELAGLGAQRAADPPAARATPISSACRSTASTTRGRCWSGPAPGRPPPGSRSARSPRRSCSQALGVTCCQPRGAHRRGRGAGRDAAGPGRPDRGRRPTRCAASTRPPASAMVAEIDAARRDGDTLGGVVEVVAHGLPPGLGSHVHWDRRLDSRLAGALMGIQAIKGVEVGDGFELARRRGSEAHDEIESDGRAGVRRRTDRSGGIEGGMTTGEPLRVRAAMKPISTVPRALATVDVATGEPAVAINQRSTSARCRPPAWSPRRWWRWCWPRRRWRSSAGTRWRRPPATSAATWTRWWSK